MISQVWGSFEQSAAKQPKKKFGDSGLKLGELAKAVEFSSSLALLSSCVLNSPL